MWIQPILQRPSQRTKGETVPQKMVGTLGKTYRTTQKAQLCCISSIGSAFVYEFFNRGSSPGGGFFNNRQPHTFMSNYLSFIIKKHMWLALSGPFPHLAGAQDSQADCALPLLLEVRPLPRAEWRGEERRPKECTKLRATWAAVS